MSISLVFRKGRKRSKENARNARPKSEKVRGLSKPYAQLYKNSAAGSRGNRSQLENS